MAQRVTVHLEDDLDGGPADGTVRFTIDGTDYEIDLSSANIEKFKSSVQPFVDAARRSSKPRRGSTRRTNADYDPAAVRAWARSNKIDVPSRGRIPQSVIERFQAAGN